MIQVYRESAQLAKVEEQPSSGLIRSVKDQHRCAPPGWFRRLLLWVMGRSILWHDLWRCQCGQVWQWRNPEGCMDDNESPAIQKWVKADVSLWTQAGGAP